jgi:uncharacterized RDD family membrane protein YckC/predicted RNA-binding Zn-ribbon protein involved in translation (DUF1610 family)
MTIEFQCTSCYKTLRTAAGRAGAVAKCPDCGSPVTIPSSGDDENLEFIDGDSEFSFGEESRSTPRERSGSQDSSQSFRDQFSPNPATKPCPMCGEQIRLAAIRCRYCGEDLEDEADHGHQNTGRNLVHAGFWLRVVAIIIDWFLITVLTVIVVAIMILVGILPGDQPPGNAGQDEENAIILILVVLMWTYMTVMESSPLQGTLGKLALGLIVTDEFGQRISFGRAAGRNAARFLSDSTCSIGYIIAGFTERKQALHDLIAGCLVIKK